MNKKILLSMSLLMMISFSTGIFVEIICADSASLSPELPNFFASLWGNLKSDLFTVILALFFAVTVFLMPCVGLFILCKTFSLGFSAAYLLSVQEQGLGILFAVLFPRCLLKLPAYIGLILISWETAKKIKTSRQSRKSWRYGNSDIIKNYIYCLLALMCSSLIEVVLLQLVL